MHRHLTQEVASAIWRALLDGLDQRQAAEAAGVSLRSLERWIALGRATGEGLEGELARAVDASRQHLRARRREAARARWGRGNAS